ncbi:hypothetical protein AG1IA_00774 [Rhizoctonia solani AG-1 IA]|uniref:Uncharacterized protein n=1 Tax=Thanatephorus cucumeris (strain AG1-IA) TaxID=983506 RepID=L8X4R5_THACA|nr:hypothetical protein AG1IA_00774 [Rhizoctonia solani AG-1 IA]
MSDEDCARVIRCLLPKILPLYHLEFPMLHPLYNTDTNVYTHTTPISDLSEFPGIVVACCAIPFRGCALLSQFQGILPWSRSYHSGVTGCLLFYAQRLDPALCACQLRHPWAHFLHCAVLEYAARLTQLQNEALQDYRRQSWRELQSCRCEPEPHPYPRLTLVEPPFLFASAAISRRFLSRPFGISDHQYTALKPNVDPGYYGMVLMDDSFKMHELQTHGEDPACAPGPFTLSVSHLRASSTPAVIAPIRRQAPPLLSIITHSARTPDIMHQPMVQPMAEPIFRRGSFGMEASLKTVIPTSDAAQQFQEVLNRPERPAPSRRSSLRTVPSAFSPPPPPPPPPSSVLESMRMAPHAASMRSPSPSPIVDMSGGTDTRKIHHSPIRSPPSLSSAPRRNSSQAEHFMRSSLSPPPSANKRAYSFAKEQARKPTMPGGPIIPPSRTNSCPPDSDMFPTRGMRSNSDGYTSASTSFMTECSVSPTSPDSSQPSDIEEIHVPHIKTKAPEQASLSLAAQLEMESRRLELVWQETEKQWRDKHGTTLPRSQDMAFRRKIENGVTIKDESPIDKEWRDMWKNTNNCWSESEARWRKEDGHKRTASRNDDSHFHTADDDKVMNAIMSHFEKEMEKRRQRAERKRLEEVEQAERKRREEESDAWRATIERESESRRSSSQGVVKDHHVEHSWLPDRLLRPDITRTRSSSVIVEARPVFQRSRSGSVATIVDPLSSDVGVNPLPTNLGPPAMEHARVKRSRSSRESRESFDLPLAEDPVRAQGEKQRSEELKKNYIGTARQQHYAPATEVPRAQYTKSSDSAASDETERDIPRPKGHQRGHSATSNGESHSPRPSLSPSVSTRDVPSAVQQDSGLSIVEEVLKLEREQAALARRIQELRAAAESTEGPKPAAPAPVLPSVEQERERGREKSKDLKVKVGDQPRAKSQTVRKHTDNEGAVFKAMQERSRKTEQQTPPDSNRKPEPTVIAPEARSMAAVPPQGEPSGRVHFMSDKPSAEDLPSPTPPRVRTPGPTKIHTPARVRTPSPRSHSPVNVASTSSFVPTMARETPVVHEAVPSAHEGVASSSSPRIHAIPSQPTLRPSGKSREAGLNGANPERPKSGTMPTLSVPHVNTSSSPIDAAHDQGASPLGARTPRATNFDPDRTPRPVPMVFP